MSHRRLHPCRDCKRGRALWPMFGVCERCFDRRISAGLPPFVAQLRRAVKALEKLRVPAKGAGR